MCIVCSLRVKINADLNFSEMRRLYSIKLKKASAHRQKTKRKKELKRIHERNFENSGNIKRKKELKRIHEKKR